MREPLLTHEAWLIGLFALGWAAIGSTYLFYRQRTSYFQRLQTLFVAAHVGFATTLVAAMYRAVWNSPEAVAVSVGIDLTGGVLIGASLTITADLLANRGPLSRQSSRAYVGILVVLWLLAVVVRPFQAIGIPEFLTGQLTWVPVYDAWYHGFVVAMLVGFLFLPVRQFLHIAKQLRGVARLPALQMGIAWGGIATLLVVVNGLMRTLRIEASLLGLAGGTGMLYLAAFAFRRASFLDEWVLSLRPMPVAQAKRIDAFSEKLRVPHEKLQGERLYIFAEPGQNLEPAIGAFLAEGTTHGHPTILISHEPHAPSTPPQGVSLVVLSQEAENAAAGDQRIVVPLADHTFVLDIVRRGLRMRQDAWIAIENLSDLILHWGVASCYAFVEHLAELLGSEGVLLGTLFPSVHAPREIDTMRLLGRPLSLVADRLYYLRMSAHVGESQTVGQAISQ